MRRHHLRKELIFISLIFYMVICNKNVEHLRKPRGKRRHSYYPLAKGLCRAYLEGAANESMREESVSLCVNIFICSSIYIHFAAYLMHGMVWGDRAASPKSTATCQRDPHRRNVILRITAPVDFVKMSLGVNLQQGLHCPPSNCVPKIVIFFPPRPAANCLFRDMRQWSPLVGGVTQCM